MDPWNSASGGFAYIRQSKWVGIIAIKNEGTEIHFLSDALVVVASLDLKVPIILYVTQRATDKTLVILLLPESNVIAFICKYTDITNDKRRVQRAFHMTSPKFKLRNYRFFWVSTFMWYYGEHLKTFKVTNKFSVQKGTLLCNTGRLNFQAFAWRGI